LHVFQVYTEPKPTCPELSYGEAMRGAEDDDLYLPPHLQPPQGAYSMPPHHQLFRAAGTAVDHEGEPTARCSYTELASCHQDMPMNLVTEVG
jgi:hypothetical protein